MVLRSLGVHRLRRYLIVVNALIAFRWQCAGPFESTALAPADAAKPAVASCEFGERRQQVCTIEIGPQLVDEDEFGIGGLPKQEIRQAALAAGADHEICIWEPCAL